MGDLTASLLREWTEAIMWDAYRAGVPADEIDRAIGNARIRVMTAMRHPRYVGRHGPDEASREHEDGER